MSIKTRLRKLEAANQKPGGFCPHVARVRIYVGIEVDDQSARLTENECPFCTLPSLAAINVYPAELFEVMR
ncbi:MAG: hypothetical protein SF097_04640 [Acidobacteriota bacterium]|nr:hypothetical protein [Acidobacteriota bacterium]